MLEQIDLTKRISKKEYKEKMECMENQLAGLQRECRQLGIPVVLVFEGFGAAGKGVQINKLIHPLDPRGFQVFAINGESEEEKMHPFLWRFWTKTPARGRIAIFDRSWYRKVLVDRFEKKTDENEVESAYQEINTFERQLCDDGNVMLKFFLHIDKKEQKKRFEKLLESQETAWRVSKGDLKRNEQYKKYKQINEEMLEQTDTACAPWTIVEATDRRFAAVKIFTTVIDCLSERVAAVKNRQNLVSESVEIKTSETEASREKAEKEKKLGSSILSSVDLSVSYTKEEYKEKLEKLQGRIALLHSELYRRRIPVILGFEGWDAGGKGGAIKRLTETMDPRGYVVNPTAAPSGAEKEHHYLWRFWNTIPKDGHVGIYDRTWYGRVMVERIEGFCSKEEWQRAYKEINDMEAHFYRHGAILLKFWMHIDKEEQERRFKERSENPEKQWKITEEDWRNREKWDLYEDAVNEMIIRTSTSYAPWIVVEGNCKYYARIKVLESVVQAIEERLKKEE